ncbi:DinB family protein [Litoribacter ruber]|uniref:DinB family protein n=1 Tax=Litoribacter ruber TaxID=702568 RepID=A0AAP2G221_9BACT|nr:MULTISPECIES: DinB family protein [Litoribacter]MBS9525097.1 DinB family protein [Litoribacter alkaliphilus]MBT0811794.1 DinB family protein [Litoribacter ruber]
MNERIVPKEGEYDPYFVRYLKLIPEDTILMDLLVKQMETVEEEFLEMDEKWLRTPYQEGKWSPKELLLHITDTERVMAYRALCIGRGDLQNLPGFDEDDYASHSHGNVLSIDYLVEDFKQTRKSILLLGHSFSEQDWQRVGSANGKNISPRAIVNILAGHFIHHMNILKERYTRHV